MFGHTGYCCIFAWAHGVLLYICLGTRCTVVYLLAHTVYCCIFAWAHGVLLYICFSTRCTVVSLLGHMLYCCIFALAHGVLPYLCLGIRYNVVKPPRYWQSCLCTRCTVVPLPNLTLNLQFLTKTIMDFLLRKIRSRTISYTTMKKKTTREKEENLLRDTKLFEGKQSKTETDITHIAEKNKELVSLRKKTMGSRVYYCNQKRDEWQKEKSYQNTFVIWRKGTMLVNT